MNEENEGKFCIEHRLAYYVLITSI